MKAQKTEQVEYRIPSICKMLDGTIIESGPHPLAGFTTRQYVVTARSVSDINECHAVLCDIARDAGIAEAGFGLPVFDADQNGWLVEVTLRNAECFYLFDQTIIRRAHASAGESC